MKIKINAMLLYLIIQFGWTATSQACIAKSPLRDLSEYDQIFVGVISGVHMTHFERNIVNKKNNRFYIESSDIQMPFKVHAVVIESLKGQPQDVKELTLGGCGVIPPKLYDEVVFFVNGDNADMVKNSSKSHLEKLRSNLSNINNTQ